MPKNAHNLYYDFLRKFLEHYQPVDDAVFDKLRQIFEIRHFEKKEILVGMGEIDQYFNIIMVGLVRKYTMIGKKQVTMQLATEGHIVQSELSFNTREPSDVIVEAIEPTDLVSISFDNLAKVYRDMPQFERLGRLVSIDMYVKKELREYIHYRKTPRERFVDYISNHPEMVQRVPQKYLASYLNIKPETFSRLKHLLQKKK